MRNKIYAKYVKKLPKGCPPFDVIQLMMANNFSEKVEVWFTPDEALMVANKLIEASLGSLHDDKHFLNRFVAAKFRYAEKKGKLDL
jgi:hypothetical protein